MTAATVARPSLRRNVSWTFGGNIAYAGSFWLMWVLLARVGNNTVVGQFALGYAIATPVYAITNLSLRTIQATDAPGSPYSLAHYLGLRVASTLLGLLGICVAAVVADLTPGAVAVVVVIGLAKAFESVSDALFGFLQRQEQMDRIARSMVIKGGATLLAVIGLLVVFDSAVAAAAGLAAVWASTLLVYDAPNAIRHLPQGSGVEAVSRSWRGATVGVIRPVFEGPAFRALVRLGFPLGLVLLVSTLSVNVPRYLIGGRLGIDELGVFTAISTLIFAGDLVVSSLSQAVMPRLASYAAAGQDEAFRGLAFRLIGAFAALGVVATVAAYVAGPLVLRLIYGEEYVRYAGVFTVMIGVSGFVDLAGFLSVVIAAQRRFWAPFPINLLKLTIVAVGTFLVVEPYRLEGVAWVLLGSQALAALLLGAIAFRRAARGDESRVLPA